MASKKTTCNWSKAQETKTTSTSQFLAKQNSDMPSVENVQK